MTRHDVIDFQHLHQCCWCWQIYYDMKHLDGVVDRHVFINNNTVHYERFYIEDDMIYPYMKMFEKVKWKQITNADIEEIFNVMLSLSMIEKMPGLRFRITYCNIGKALTEYMHSLYKPYFKEMMLKLEEQLAAACSRLSVNKLPALPRRAGH